MSDADVPEPEISEFPDSWKGGSTSKKTGGRNENTMKDIFPSLCGY